MRIERNHPVTSDVAATKSGKPGPSAPSPAVSDLTASERLNQALANTTEVRADQVARAKALVADPNYPSEKQMSKIAGLLAANWQSGE
jgi:hypothetical protein